MILARSLGLGRFALFRAAAFCIALPGLVAAVSAPAHAAAVLEERKLPMRFTWVACEPNCRGWIGAVGVVTGDTVKDFDEFNSRLLSGDPVVAPRMIDVPVRLPLPPAKRQGSIYETQSAAKKSYFTRAA